MRPSRAERLTAAHFTAIGALSEVVFGGDVSLANGGQRSTRTSSSTGDASEAGRHLIEAAVRLTLELILT